MKKDDEARRKILARRASFVAATLAGVTACHDEPKRATEPTTPLEIPSMDAAPPMPCLSPVALPPVDAGAEPETPTFPDASAPVPCLSVSLPRDAGPPPVPPQPCLSPMPPQPCLKVKPPAKP